MSSSENYLHGFTTEEQDRLYRQARFLEHIIYKDIDLSASRQLLEVGSGVGAQSQILLRRFPELQLTCLDFSPAQIARATAQLAEQSAFSGRYTIRQMDATDMDLPSAGAFDAAFLCWVLEHVPDPQKVLSEVRRVLQPGSRVYITEVLNATFFLEPYSPNVWQYWMKYNDWQFDNGGDPFVGAKLGNLLQSLGYTTIQTSIKTIHLDNRQPGRRAEMIAFWSDLLQSGVPQMLKAGYVDENTVTKMKEEMHRVAKDPNAVFFYSFVQATAETS
jgi:ubiquinone/menaquinone biosynthesis C-methylase UbiE